MLSGLINSIIAFLAVNYLKIIAVLVLAYVFYLIFFLSTYSLKNLKIEVFKSYPFDPFLPRGGTWSIGYYLIIIILLGIIVFLGFEGKLFLGPA